MMLVWTFDSNFWFFKRMFLSLSFCIFSSTQRVRNNASSDCFCFIFFSLSFLRIPGEKTELTIKDGEYDWRDGEQSDLNSSSNVSEIAGVVEGTNKTE